MKKEKGISLIVLMITVAVVAWLFVTGLKKEPPRDPATSDLAKEVGLDVRTTDPKKAAEAITQKIDSMDKANYERMQKASE